MPDAISRALKERITAEAGYRCGYCLTDQRVSGAQMHIEHLIPRARGGGSEPANLWLSCAWCNSYKGTQTEALDPDTGDRGTTPMPIGSGHCTQWRVGCEHAAVAMAVPPGRQPKTSH